VRRIFLSFAAGLSAAIFLASIVMWVRSYWHDDQLQRVVVKNLPSRNEDVVSAQHVRLSSSRGKVALALMRSRTPHPFEASPTVALHAGPPIARWQWTNFSDDLNDVRKASKKWERRYVFEYGRVIHVVKADKSRGILPGGSVRSSYLVVWRPEVVLILGLIAWLLVRRELNMRRRSWRLLRGYCVECGYDLRKSLGACPECGKGRWGLE
jgi:hypothetical protein